MGGYPRGQGRGALFVSVFGTGVDHGGSRPLEQWWAAAAHLMMFQGGFASDRSGPVDQTLVCLQVWSPFSSWIFLWKRFSPDITPWWKPKCGKWEQLGNFPQRHALIWIKMLIEMHSASVFCWPTLQDYIPFVSLSFLSFSLSLNSRLTIDRNSLSAWVWSLTDSKRAQQKMLQLLAFPKGKKTTWAEPWAQDYTPLSRSRGIRNLSTAAKFSRRFPR